MWSQTGCQQCLRRNTPAREIVGRPAAADKCSPGCNAHYQKPQGTHDAQPIKNPNVTRTRRPRTPSQSRKSEQVRKMQSRDAQEKKRMGRKTLQGEETEAGRTSQAEPRRRHRRCRAGGYPCPRALPRTPLREKERRSGVGCGGSGEAGCEDGKISPQQQQRSLACENSNNSEKQQRHHQHALLREAPPLLYLRAPRMRVVVAGRMDERAFASLEIEQPVSGGILIVTTTDARCIQGFRCPDGLSVEVSRNLLSFSWWRVMRIWERPYVEIEHTFLCTCSFLWLCLKGKFWDINWVGIQSILQ